MSEETGIEWTDKTWNPSTGCSKVSEGCKFCYAETMADRLEAMGNPRYDNGFEFTRIFHANSVARHRRLWETTIRALEAMP